MKASLIKTIKKHMPSCIYKILVRIRSEIKSIVFRVTYPNTKIFFNTETIDKFHSQENQDNIVFENFFKTNKKGFFCDIGGNHPVIYNNTLFFEEQGWNGIAFEPLPHLKELWDNQRNAKLFPFALSNKDGEVVFNIVANENSYEDMYSFVKGSREENHGFIGKEILVKTKKLQDILDQEKIRVVDYLSLDVEGHELNVIEGIDFNKVRINVLTIENNPPFAPVFGDKKIREMMFKNDFILWGRIYGLDDIYVNKSFLNEIS